MFQELILLQFSDEREKSTLFGPLARANLSHWMMDKVKKKKERKKEW
jgi:hypothetical protein